MYQDVNSPGGAHEYKLEVLYEYSYSNAQNASAIMKLKFRRRGAFGAWYSKKPESYSISGTTNLYSNEGQFYYVIGHYIPVDLPGPNPGNPSSTESRLIYADQSSLNPFYIIDDLSYINTGDALWRWIKDCHEYSIQFVLEHNTGANINHSAAF